MLREITSGIPLADIRPGPSADDLLLDEVDIVDGAHAIVIGDGALPILCGLIRRGAAAAAERLLSDRSIPEPVEIALLPHVEDRDAATRGIALARRSLLPCGRIVIRAIAGTSNQLVGEIVALLREGGFAAIRTRGLGSVNIISADRPLFGSLHNPVARA